MHGSPKSHVLLIHMFWQMEACFIPEPNIFCKCTFLFCSFFCSTYQIKKKIVIPVCCRLSLCFVFFVSCKGILPQNAAHCCWSLCFVFCSAKSPRTDHFRLSFSITGLIASILAIDLPVFRLPLCGTSSTDPVFTNLLTNRSYHGLF